MTPHTPHDLDALVDRAFQEGPIRPAPARLGRRIKDRLMLASLLERERKRFRYPAAVVSALAAASLTAGAIGALLVGVPEPVARSAPGAFAFLDYFSAALTQSLSNFPGMLAALCVILLAAAILLVMASLPSLRSAISAGWRAPSARPEISPRPSTERRRA